MRIPPLFDELAALGKTSVKADISSVPELNDFDPEHCYLSWDINIETDKTEADIRSVFIFVEDYAAISIKKLGNIAKQDSQKTSPTQKSSLVVDRRRSDSTSIRVKNEKLDTLVNLVGEMVTLHARLQQESNKAELPEFVSIAESLGRLTADLRDIAMSVRMVPLTETF